MTLMSDEDRKLLEILGPDLMMSTVIEGSDLLARLKSKGALTRLQEEDIKGEKTNYQMVERLLYFLGKGSSNIVDLFIESLEASGQQHVANLILRTTEVKGHFRLGLHQRLLDWAPSIQKMILKKRRQAEAPTTGQKLSAVMAGRERDTQLPVSSIGQLLQMCKDGRRIVIYGEAGSGKTTALQNIALCWLEGRVATLQRYNFVFLIPLRLVQSHRIVDIICQDCKLLPRKFGDSLSRILSVKSERSNVLFLLDSYEELRVRVEEIDKLISCDLYPEATVFITSRLGSQLPQVEPTPCIKAQLQNLSEEDVERFVERHSEDDQEMLANIEDKFGMSFLGRPINLVLACYMYMAVGSEGLHRSSQTELFGQIILQLLIVYSDKVCPLADLPIRNVLELFCIEDRRLIGTKSFFMEICRQCYQALRKDSVWLSTANTSFTADDLVDFGLFFHGLEPNTVDLPHRLFQEFLSAVYLVRDPNAWEEMFMEIKEDCCQDFASPRHLVDVLRPAGLENVVRFVLGLSSGARRHQQQQQHLEQQQQHLEQLCSLFVMKQQKVVPRNYCQSVYAYELELLRECVDDSQKRVVAEALLNSPISMATVRGNHRYAHNNGAEQLLNIFTIEQSIQFLCKAYNCVLTSDVTLSLCRNSINCEEPFVLDSFVLALIREVGCTALHMGKSLTVILSDISVNLFPMITSGVGEFLYIRDCSLVCGQGFRQIAQCSLVRKTHSTSPPTLHVRLVRVKGVEKVRDCGLVLPSVHSLDLFGCGNVDICALSLTYPQLRELCVGSSRNRLTYGTDFRPWLGMRKVELEESGEVRLSQLAQLCPQLTDLVMNNCQVSWIDLSHQWPSLQRLKLKHCGLVRLSLCQQLCPALKCLILGSDALYTDEDAVYVDGIETPWHSLQTLELLNLHLVQSEEGLTEEKARHILKDLYPAARIQITGYMMPVDDQTTLDNQPTSSDQSTLDDSLPQSSSKEMEHSLLADFTKLQTVKRKIDTSVEDDEMPAPTKRLPKKRLLASGKTTMFNATNPP